MKRLHAVAAAFFALLLATTVARAADLVIARGGEPSAMDPHFSRITNNIATSEHTFDRLVENDVNLQLHPALALTWRSVDPLTWEVKLRPNVKFHDGSPFTAEDVVFSVERIPTVPNSPSSYASDVSSIRSMTIVDPLTIRFTTKAPTPHFIEEMNLVFIVSKKATQGKETKDFNTGAATIGTGPYKFKEWVPGDHMTLVRNDDYWGGKPQFDTVTIRFISNDAARVAALRSGAVDLIDAVPATDIPALKQDKNIHIAAIDSPRLYYLALDAARDESPFIVGADGKPLKPNPLKDRRVRLALSKLINRKLLVDRVLDGSGVPAGQFAPTGIGGHASDLAPEGFDIEGARKLLAEAGYPNGFGITVHSSNDRFYGDSAIGQAVGQMFARGGLKVNGVVTQPYNVYASAATRREYSAFIFSFGITTPTSAMAMKNVLMTYDANAGTGALNRMRYSNPAFDDAVRKALGEFDAKRRTDLLAEAGRIAMKDVAVIPICWPTIYWATRGNIVYTATRGEDTVAMLATIKH